MPPMSDRLARPRRPSVVALLSIGLFALFSPTSTAAGQEDRGSSDRRAVLARAAMLHHLRQTGNSDVVAEMYESVRLYGQGLSPTEIYGPVLETRRKLSRLRTSILEGDVHVREDWQIVLRALGRGASHVAGMGSTGVEAANMLIHYIDQWAATSILPRQLQRYARDYGTNRPGEEAVLALVSRTCHEEPDYCDKVWKPLFERLFPVAPNTRDREVLDQYPAFANNVRIREILEALDDQGQLTRAILEGFDEQRSDVAQLRDEVSSALDQPAPAEALLRGQRRQAVEMEGRRAALTLATTFIGIRDRQLGRELQAIGDAGFAMHAALNRVHQALGDGANQHLAALALTGNMFTVVTGLASAFADGGSSSDEIIIEELGKLRQDVDRLRTEVHDRFDEVHEQLDHIWADMLGGLEEIADGIGDLTARFGNVKSQLNEIAEVQLDVEDLVISQAEMLYRAGVRQSLAECGEDRTYDGRAPMTIEIFRNCRARIEKLREDLPTRQFAAPDAGTTEENLLSASPDRAMSLSLNAFRRLLERTEGGERRSLALPGSVVGPTSWFYLVDIHDEFLATHLGHTAIDALNIEESEFVRTMRDHRNDLVRFAEAIRDELTEFQREQGSSTAFSAFFSEVLGLVEELDTVIRTIVNDYYQDGNLFSNPYRLREDGTALPEIAFDQVPGGRAFASAAPHEAAWAAVGEVYGKGRPEWVRVRPCEVEDLEPQQVDLSERASRASSDSLEGERILNYVHPHDAMPARLGIADLDVCVGAVSSVVEHDVSEWAVRWEDHNRASWRVRVPHKWRTKTRVDLWMEISLDMKDGRFDPVSRWDWGAMAGESCGDLVLYRQYGSRENRIDGDDDVTRRWSPEDGELAGMVRALATRETPEVAHRSAFFRLGKGGAACKREYLRRLADEQNALAGYVRQRLGESEAFRAIAREIAVANEHLRSWIGLAFDRAVGRLGPAAAIAGGFVSLPDLAELVSMSQLYRAGSLSYGGFPPWSLAATARGRVEALEAVLRSEKMRDTAGWGFGHRVLTRTHFANLDGFGPGVLERWSGGEEGGSGAAANAVVVVAVAAVGAVVLATMVVLVGRSRRREWTNGNVGRG